MRVQNFDGYDPAENQILGFVYSAHSTFTYLMLPGTGFAEFFKREVTPAEMAERVQCFIEAGAE